MTKLEVVTHCWNYSRLLTYQLSSFYLYPPEESKVRVTVFYAEEDTGTKQVFDFFSTLPKPKTVKIVPSCLPRRNLMCRAYGRHLAAQKTSADLIWFTDVDYCFGPGCLDTLAKLTNKSVHKPKRLFYPRVILGSKKHVFGDKAIAKLDDGLKVIDIERDDFGKMTYSKAIGGVQIIRGDTARKLGYCKDHVLGKCNMSDNWLPTIEDRVIRVILGTNGQPLELPNVFRIRHSRSGRFEQGLRL